MLGKSAKHTNLLKIFHQHIYFSTRNQHRVSLTLQKTDTVIAQVYELCSYIMRVAVASVARMLNIPEL